MTPEQFDSEFNVPRGTIDSLTGYEALLLDWQTRMNLVGPATLSDVWGRHFADSAQLSRLIPQGRSWLDIGAGGGFPGLVLSAMGWGQFTLVDSIAKKCRFLEAVRDELKLDARIICARVESLPTLGVEVATARAAAPLATLFEWAIRHVRPGGTFVFPKGRRWAEEVEDARKLFNFDLETHPSITDAEARILVATHVGRR
ncbi:16S rRNA (guanine(527)-N(7))-methyltransferase RsmG [Sandaracinobacteroides hominis]|uniref:16S rRNA (guanine(527)-N(7))-methyltransferase RsmG n=1 Tax=Sandaracinobacteroides hominis TaxID=2780086 RepID=UPI001A9C798D|nr:16S rRNA (guanine(527)-N(7))-methyltransferase RsmG [Sandaracinobacteroides hominis]